MDNNFSTNSSLFSVTFFNGDNEFDIGKVEITPSLTFKAFQSLISSKLFISPHQITIYFQPFEYNHRFHHRRRPVTSKFEFGSICNGLNSSYFFWVVQKRPRRSRRRNNHNHNNNRNYSDNNNHPGENFSFLRRGGLEYLMALNLNSNVYNELSIGDVFNGGGGYNSNFIGGGGGRYNRNLSDDGATSTGGGSSSASSNGICEVCYSGDTVAFHWCINDAITMIFRSPAGPIAPPLKKIDFVR